MSGEAVWIHRKIAGALVGYEPVSERVLVVRLNAKPRNITPIQVYGPTTATTDEEMERFYQDLSQAVKQVHKRDMLLIVGDFNAKVCRREPSTMSSAVGLYGLGEMNEAGEQLEDFCFGSMSWLRSIPCSNNIQGGCIHGPLLMATPGIG